MNVLVTGVSGFIGNNFLEFMLSNCLIAEKDQIYIVSKNPPTINNVQIKIIKVSNYIYEKRLWERAKVQFDVVFHLGSFTPKNSTSSNDLEGSESIILSTTSLIRSLAIVPKKFIYISTLDVYKMVGKVISEETPVEPKTLYGLAKLYTERWLEHWAFRNNVILQILRLGHIYGPGEASYQKFIPITIKNVLKGKAPQIYSDGTERRSYLYIDDCIRMIWAASLLSKYVRPINVASENSFTVNEIANYLCEKSEMEITPQILNKLKNAKDITFLTSKMNQFLGVEQTDFFKGLDEEFTYFQKRIK